LECQGGIEVDTCDPLAGANTEGPPGKKKCRDSKDNDCDGLTDLNDRDCHEITETDINCFDGIDNDLDGLLDCEDPECDGVTDGSCSTGQPGICSSGTLTCQNSIEECVADNQPQAEICDGLDNDCDNQVDEDYVPTPTFCGLGACSGNIGQLECQGGSEVDTCDPFAGATAEGPPGDETCSDTLDNDCDGLTDDTEDPDCQICSQYSDRKSCNSDPNCTWNGKQKTCFVIVNCEEYTDQGSCEAVGCAWNSRKNKCR
jgi:hypothetical protein